MHEEFLSRFLAHRGEIQAFVLSVVRDWTRSEDIMQEVALVLWRKYGEYDVTRPFGAWARGVAAVEVMKNRDRQRRDLPLLAPEAIAAVEAAYEALDDDGHGPRLDALRRCLGRLAPGARELIDLRYHADLPLDQVATRTGRSLAAVTKALLRLRSALEQCVRSQLAAERAT